MDEINRLDHLTDLYLRNELSPEERAEFELLLSTDTDWRASIEQDKETVAALRLYTERRKLQRESDMAYSELRTQEEKSKKKIFGRLFRMNYPIVATAAAAVALVVISTTVLVRNLGSIKEQQHENYMLLRRDLERMKNSNDVSTIPGPENVQEERFSGTGIAIAPQGYIATGYHVIKNADSVFIENEKGRYKVDVVISDKVHDVAILKIIDESFEGFRTLPYAVKTTDSEIGERVFTLGYPRKDPVYGDGSISALSGYEGDSTAYQVSVPVNPGNSGGPLLNEEGDLIGLISGKHTLSDGAAFAIKAKYLADLFDFVAENAEEAPALPKKNSLKGMKRAGQLKKLQDFVFYVQIYKGK